MTRYGFLSRCRREQWRAVKGTISNISNTRENSSSDFQTPKSELKTRGIAEFFFLFLLTLRCFDIGGRTLSNVSKYFSNSWIFLEENQRKSLQNLMQIKDTSPNHFHSTDLRKVYQDLFYNRACATCQGQLLLYLPTSSWLPEKSTAQTPLACCPLRMDSVSIFSASHTWIVGSRPTWNDRINRNISELMDNHYTSLPLAC